MDQQSCGTSLPQCRDHRGSDVKMELWLFSTTVIDKWSVRLLDTNIAWEISYCGHRATSLRFTGKLTRNDKPRSEKEARSFAKWCTLLTTRQTSVQVLSAAYMLSDKLAAIQFGRDRNGTSHYHGRCPRITDHVRLCQRVLECFSADWGRRLCMPVGAWRRRQELSLCNSWLHRH